VGFGPPHPAQTTIGRGCEKLRQGGSGLDRAYRCPRDRGAAPGGFPAQGDPQLRVVGVEGQIERDRDPLLNAQTQLMRHPRILEAGHLHKTLASHVHDRGLGSHRRDLFVLEAGEDREQQTNPQALSRAGLRCQANEGQHRKASADKGPRHRGAQRPAVGGFHDWKVTCNDGLASPKAGFFRGD